PQPVAPRSRAPLTAAHRPTVAEVALPVVQAALRLAAQAPAAPTTPVTPTVATAATRTHVRVVARRPPVDRLAATRRPAVPAARPSRSAATAVGLTAATPSPAPRQPAATRRTAPTRRAPTRRVPQQAARTPIRAPQPRPPVATPPTVEPWAPAGTALTPSAATRAPAQTLQSSAARATPRVELRR